MFKTIKLKSTYSTISDEIGSDFYTPVLSHSVTYDRATAYFSAKALSNYAQGLENFSKNGHKYRLIISTEIDEINYNEIKQGYELRNEIKTSLLSKLNEEITKLDEFNLSNLAYLIAIGTIDIKMAFVKHGIFHDKFGIMKDKEDSIICFRGSNNETDAAFKSNYEAFDITCSWQASDFDYSKITKSIDTFENLWNDNMPNIIVKDIDNVIKQKILDYNKGKVFFEPVLLEKNSIILDYDSKLILNLNIDANELINTPKYKRKINYRVDYTDLDMGEIYFKTTLTYISYKDIIQILESISTQKNYNFFVTKRLENHIKDKELYIKERASLGLAIKQQHSGLTKKFIEYKNVVDSNMTRNLREKQMWDSFYMCTMQKSSNFSVPGSGKTSSVLGVYAYLAHHEFVDKIVMIGPKNSFGSWIDEFNASFGVKKKLNLFNIQNYSSVREKKNATLYSVGGANLLLFNYESLNSILDEVCELIDNKTLLVYDEVHKIKAINGQRAEDSLEVSKNAKYIITMTGTPIPNSYSDIRNMLNILYHDEYADFFNFTDSQLKNPSSSDIGDINNKIQPFFCRTTKEQLSVPVASPDIFLNTLASRAENEIFNILCMKYAKNKLALIIRLLQLESNPKMLLKAIDSGGEDFSDILYTQGTIDEIDYKDYSATIVSLINSIEKTTKFKLCIENILKLYHNKKPVIVWCIFVDSILRIQKKLESLGLKVDVIFGNVDNEKRGITLDEFKEGKIDVLITNPHTLAESVSLHGICHDAIYFEYSYNLVHLLQSKDRIHRLGLKDNQYTQYYYLQTEYVTADNSRYSLDEKIYNRLLEKEQTMLEAIENNKLEPVSVDEEDINIIFNDLKL